MRLRILPHLAGPLSGQKAVVSINQLTSPPITAANEVVENGIRRTLIETA
jgi:hypothetical protein